MPEEERNPIDNLVERVDAELAQLKRMKRVDALKHVPRVMVDVLLPGFRLLLTEQGEFENYVLEQLEGAGYEVELDDELATLTYSLLTTIHEKELTEHFDTEVLNAAAAKLMQLSEQENGEEEIEPSTEEPEEELDSEESRESEESEEETEEEKEKEEEKKEEEVIDAEGETEKLEAN